MSQIFFVVCVYVYVRKRGRECVCLVALVLNGHRQTFRSSWYLPVFKANEPKKTNKQVSTKNNLSDSLTNNCERQNIPSSSAAVFSSCLLAENVISW